MHQDIQTEQCLCTTATCGAGMVDATNSVFAAERPIAAVSRPASVSPGQNVNAQRLRQRRGLRPDARLVRLDGGFPDDQSAADRGCEHGCGIPGRRPRLGIDHATRDRHRRSGSSRCRGGGRRARSHHLHGAGVRRQRRLRHPVTSGPTPVGPVIPPPPARQSSSRIRTQSRRRRRRIDRVRHAHFARNTALATPAVQICTDLPLQLIDIALYLRRTPLMDQGLRYNYN